ncbi:hypothetical protein D1007_16547 [Hordeum vulgare]|nr:hypothetical protein D1007_16547 [Hordeum vulgare]
MFQSLERRASQALSDICGEGVSIPLVPDDVGYLGFFSRVVERLEVAAENVFSQTASDVFCHLLHLDPGFDFAILLDPVPETIRDALAEWVEVHVEYLVISLAPEGCGVSCGDDASS